MNNRQRLTLAGIIIAFVIIFVAGVLAIRSQRVPYVSKTQPETTTSPGQTPLVITNMGPLADILLNEQFDALKRTLNNHLGQQYPKAQTASVTDQPQIAADGTITFHMSIDNPRKTVSVVVQRINTGAITVLIPEDSNFSQTVDVYGNKD